MHSHNEGLSALIIRPFQYSRSGLGYSDPRLFVKIPSVMSENSEERRIRLFTIGHSKHSLDEFLSILNVYEIKSLVDVRSYPTSSRYPQYDWEALEISLVNRGITYHWFQDLGGWRQGLCDQSPNQGLPEGVERNYADYMLSDPFHSSAGRLLGIARIRKTAIMCAEKDPHHCHRQYISDYLLLHSTDVYHILDEEQCTQHHMTKHAVIAPDQKLVYPAHDQPGHDLLFEP